MAKKQDADTSFKSAAQSFEGIFEGFLKPFLRGVFLSDPDLESALTAQAILRSFILGRPGVPAKGVQEFSNILAKPLKKIHINERVERLEGELVHTSAATYQAKRVVVATDSATASALIASVESVPMSASTTWYHSVSADFSFSNKLRVNKQGEIINSLIISDRVTSYAPLDKKLISTTVLNDISESEVSRGLAQMWSSPESDFTLVGRYEIPQSLPTHSVGTPLIRKVQISSTLFVAGDHRGLPSQQGAMDAGRRVAEIILGR